MCDLVMVKSFPRRLLINVQSIFVCMNYIWCQSIIGELFTLLMFVSTMVM